MGKQLCHVGLRIYNKRVALNVDFAGSYTQNLNNINNNKKEPLFCNLTSHRGVSFRQSQSGNWMDQLQSTDFFPCSSQPITALSV